VRTELPETFLPLVHIEGIERAFALEIDLGITFDPIGFGEDAGAMLTARMPPRAGLNCEGHISDERDALSEVARVFTQSTKPLRAVCFRVRFDWLRL